MATSGKARNPWLLPVLIVGVLALIGCAACAAGGFFLYRVGQRDVERFAPPFLIEKLKDGWATYHFRDLGFSVELPERPMQDRSPAEFGETFFWERASGYEAPIDGIYCWIHAAKHRTGSDARDELRPRTNVGYLKDWYRGLQVEHEEHEVGGLSGRMYTGDGSDEDGQLKVQMFVWGEAKLVVLLTTSYYTPDEEAEAITKRIYGSLRKTPK
jgi:hypothetical protein